MKRFLFILSTLFLIGGLAACGSADSDDNNSGSSGNNNGSQQEDTDTGSDNQSDGNTQDNNTQDGNTDNAGDDMQAKTDELDIYEFEIEVSYGKNKEYEAKIDQDEEHPVKAEIEDELNDVYLNGQEAFDQLYDIIKDLTLTKDSSKEEAIDQILQGFDLANDYEKFDLEINYHDGSELEVEDRK